MARRLKLILWVVLCATAASAQVPIPNTPAGHLLAAWLNAFNSGDRVKIDLFLKSYAPRLTEAALTSAQFRGLSGGLTLQAITRSDRTSIAFRVQEKSQPTVLLGKIDVTASRAPTIFNFTLRAVPQGAVLEDIKLDAALRKQVIQDIIAALNQRYVFPDTAQKMADNLVAHEAKGDYNTITDGDTFAALITTHLLDVSHDKHISVFYNPYTLAADPPPVTDDQANEDRKAMARDCGFRKLEILPNNIGYLKLDFFADPMACGRTAAMAISFLANTDAIIVDLRENGGGDPRMVAMVSTYFFDKPVHLNNFYDRQQAATEYWTLRYVPGIRLGHKPAYFLTSQHTFSGAEEFAYDLHNLHRVTVVGETTAGGSHPVSPFRAGEHFTIFVPNARSISPVTNTDWERTGVVPDVQVSADDALETAARLAAQTIQQNSNPDKASAQFN